MMAEKCCRPVAPTVEQRTPNPRVGGSNPSWPATENVRRFVTKIIKFFYEVLAELRLVKWPSRRDLLIYSSVVVFVVIIAAIILSGMDYCFAYLIRLIMG